ncbi:zinc finger MYND domain-containing protein [Sporobolomyces salmoneus]|uniref:zinc finger MYND domain-containing protein n=1 Tax=Sporobolomyces salmoneus TaxID=183962 RepID=UPI0031803B93
MNSSKPSSSTTSTLGECVVCGKETAIGCSVCKKAGLDWMYFCSVDHQKLIWNSHKRVCGKNPFEWPTLTDDEAKAAWEVKDLPFSSDGPMTWNDYFMTSMAITLPGEAQRLAREGPDAGFSSFLAKMKSSNSDKASQSLTRQLRATVTSLMLHKAGSLPQTSANAQKIALLYYEEAMGFTAWSESRFERNFTLPSDWTWSSEFQHRLLILNAVAGVALSRMVESDVEMRLLDSPLVQHSISVISSFDMTELSRSEPGRARRAVKELLALVLNSK